QHHEMFPPLCVRLLDYLAQKRVGLKSGILEVLVNDYHVVAVSLELKDDVLLEQTEVHFIGQVDELWNDNFLILLMIDTDQRCVFAEIGKCRIGFLFHKLMKRVLRQIEAQAGIEIGVYAASFLDQIKAAGNTPFTRREKSRGFLAD